MAHPFFTLFHSSAQAKKYFFLKMISVFPKCDPYVYDSGPHKLGFLKVNL